MTATLMVVLAATVAHPGRPVDWRRPDVIGGDPRWGIEGHLQFSIPPSWGGPRGLIRVLYPTLEGGRYDLINFIAIEPIVAGGRGYSELEWSALDGVPGKRIWTESPRGALKELGRGVEELSVDLRVERFESGAEVRLTASIRSDKPDEIRFTTWASPGSKPMDLCILTATMGNKARARLLWLAHGPVRASALWPGFGGNGFAETRAFGAAKMRRLAEGEVEAAITTDEPDPRKAVMQPGSEGWAYMGFPVTQYWRAKGDDCRLAVNARATYWAIHKPIPGGPAIENFEFRQPFRDGAAFTFGVTPKRPGKLGFKGD